MTDQETLTSAPKHETVGAAPSNSSQELTDPSITGNMSDDHSGEEGAALSSTDDSNEVVVVDDADCIHVTFFQTLWSLFPGQTSKPPEALDSWSSAFILVNFISAGYILNPAAFAQGGLLLGSVCLAFVSLQSMITGVYVLEACTRAEMLKVSCSVAADHTGSGYGTRLRLSESHRNLSQSNRLSSVGSLLNEGSPLTATTASRRYLPRRHSLRVHQRTYELSELCRIFLGRRARTLFTMTTLGDLYGITWTFAAVFGSSLSEHLPMGLGDDTWEYVVYIFVFMAITIPASCSRISVQVPLQLIFLLARTIMLLLMLGTLYAAYASDTPHFGTQRYAARETPLANWGAIVTTLQTAVFSTAYQFSVPGLTGETGNKGAMRPIISRSVAYIYCTNLILSLLMATYFGEATQASSNLNWIDYHGGTWDGTGDVITRSWWASAVSSYIVLFAALDGLAVYPLIAMSLGDILMGAIYEDEVHHVQENWRIRTFFRLIASVPQACGALFLKDLGVIAKYAGIFTVMSYTICPSILAIRSRKHVRRAGLPSNTRYKTIFSNDYVAYCLIVLSFLLIFGVFVDAMLGLSDALVERVTDEDEDETVSEAIDYSNYLRDAEPVTQDREGLMDLFD